MTIRSIVAPFGVAAALIVVLAGCTSNVGGDTSSEENTSADPARFVACLQGKGVDAKILDDGSVGVRIGDAGAVPPPPPQPGSASGWVMLNEDGAGLWQSAERAEGFDESSGIRESYLACEAEIPGFAQPERQMGSGPGGGGNSEAILAANLEFASCARENGLADFADPMPPTGALVFPGSLTEDQFRAVLMACGNHIEEIGFAATPAMEELPFDWKAVLGEELDGIRITMSQVAPQ